MRSRIMPGVLVMLLGWILAPGLAYAVALGKIDVTSHLGEPFYAEVPLQLEKGEKLSGVSVEIAQPDDYRILEVYRDAVLNTIRTDVEDDTRGPRIKLISDAAIESPFFNLVLKVHYGNATSFKKYPVFLDLPSAAVSTAKPKPQPKVQAPKPAAKQAVTETPEPQPVAQEKKQAPAAQSSSKKEAAPFKPFSGWARIGRYGPMVYGDTIMTVARRLRVDDRYTIKQVMVALFEKNKDKFDKENMNLIKAGSYLNVPTTKEVEAITPRQAIKFVAEQDRQWQALKKQPHYAAVDKAQKTRYSARVKVGESADGVPATAEPGKEMKGERGVQLPSKAKPAPSTTAVASAKTAAPAGETADQTSSELQALQQQNAKLQQKLTQADENIAALNAKLASPDLVASNARIKKLELKLARMQTQLDAARQQAAIAAKNSINNWLVYGLGGLAVILLAVIGYLLRRERPHPAEQLPPEEATPFEDEFSAQPSTGMFEPEDVAPRIESVDEAVEHEVPQPAEEFSYGEEPAPVTEEESGQESVEQEGVSEEADPNVDYVAEADVYLRYGMEEEALRQLRMAILQRQDNVDAYCKLAKLLQSRGEMAELDTLIEDGRSALSGDALARFESEVTLLGSAEAETSGAEGAGLTDMGTPAGEESDVVGEVDLSGSDETELDMGELDWSLTDEEQPQPEAPSPETGEEAEASPFVADDEGDASIAFDLSDMEEEGEAAMEADDETAQQPQQASEAGEAMGGIDLDLSELMTDEEAAGDEEAVGTEAPDHAPSAEAEEEQHDHDVSEELGELLGELNMDAEADAPRHDDGVTAGSLAIDMARSLLAQGQLDDAEMTLRSAVDGDFRGQALLGLAEVAQQRDDMEKAAQMLAEAEPLLDDNSREWFERLKEKQGE